MKLYHDNTQLEDMTLLAKVAFACGYDGQVDDEEIAIIENGNYLTLNLQLKYQ